MILTVAELRQYIETEETDAVLEMKLQALESAIQKHTNNDFKRCLTAEGEYPADIKKGIVDMMQWDLTHRAKVGIASETLARHSVTYFDMGAGNSALGFPKALTGFLKPYRRVLV